MEEKSKSQNAAKNTDESKSKVGAISFTKDQVKEVQKFKETLRNGSEEIAFAGSVAEGVEFVKNLSEKGVDELKSLAHNKVVADTHVDCPGCDGKIIVPKDSVKGEVLACMDCGESFEIVAVGPEENEQVKIKPAEKIGEDWGE